MTPPLIAKRSYIWIQSLQGVGNTINYTSYSTGWRMNTSAENVMEAVVNGTDTVPDVEIHGITARGTINLILSTDEAHIFQSLGANELGDGSLVGYSRSVDNLQKEDPEFSQVEKLNIIIAPLQEQLGSLQDDDGNPLGVEDIRTKFGYVYELNRSAILDAEVTGESGDFVRMRLEVKTGAFTIWQNEQT